MKKIIFSIILSVMLIITIGIPDSTSASTAEGAVTLADDYDLTYEYNDEDWEDEDIDYDWEDDDSDAEKEDGYIPAVDDFVVRSFTSSSVEVFWFADNDWDAEGYVIYYSEKGDFPAATTKTIESNAIVGYEVIKNLKKNKGYYFKIAAYGYYEGNKIFSDSSEILYAKPKPNKRTISNWDNQDKLKVKSARLSYSGKTLIIKIKYQNKTRKKIRKIKRTEIVLYSELYEEDDDWDEDWDEYSDDEEDWDDDDDYEVDEDSDNDEDYNDDEDWDDEDDGILVDKVFGSRTVNLKKNRSKWVTYKIPYSDVENIINLRYDIENMYVDKWY